MTVNRLEKTLQDQHVKLLNLVRAKDSKAAEVLASIQLGWFSIKNADGGDNDTAEVYVYDEIMPKWLADIFGGVSAEGMIEELNKITASTINVKINSPGGSVFEAIAIYNALVTHSATINVFVDALAASAASIIAMAGDKITMMVGSQLMIHDAMGGIMGNAAEMRDFAKFLDTQSDNLASIYAAKAGGELKDWRAMMVAETWMMAAEAVELGLADEVYTKAPPKEEPEPDPNDPDEPEEDEQEESAENLLKRKHNLVNRGFKYAGRKRAPNPVPTDSIDDEIDEIVANNLKKLGRV